MVCLCSVFFFGVFFQDPAWIMKLNWSVPPSGSHAVINSPCQTKKFSQTKIVFGCCFFWSTFDLFVLKRNFYGNIKQPLRLQIPMGWVHFQQTPRVPSPCQQSSNCIHSGCEFVDPNLKSDPRCFLSGQQIIKKSLQPQFGLVHA